MTLAMRDRFGISKQRGFWLRCFLEIMELYVKGTGFSPYIEAAQNRGFSP